MASAAKHLNKLAAGNVALVGNHHHNAVLTKFNVPASAVFHFRKEFALNFILIQRRNHENFLVVVNEFYFDLIWYMIRKFYTNW